MAAVRDGLHNKARSPVRRRPKRDYEENKQIYKQRYIKD